ncbi:MAG: prolyl oligopeptidase, partial [Verrucomicrobiota bacterium]
MKRTFSLLGLVPFLTTLLFAADKAFVYPQAPKGGQVDDYFGTKVADPYRDLENVDADATKKWIEAENKLTFDYLATIPERKKINEKLTALWNYEKFTIPFHEGGRYFFSRNTGLQNQNVVFTSDKLPADGKVLIDPNALSKDGTVALSGIDITDDGKLMAYGLAVAGSDWQEWKVRDIETGKDLSDDVQWVKFSSASWKKDGTGFFYSRYDAPASADQLKQANYFHKLYFHKLGTPQSDDALVYERKDHKDWNFNGTVSEDGRFLILNVSQGTDPKNRIFYRDLQKSDAPVVELLNKQDAAYDFLGCEGNTFWFKTDLAAPRGRIVAIDITKPEEIRTVVPETADKLEDAEVVGDRFIASYLKDAHSAVRLFDLGGKEAGEIKLPGLGTASGFKGKRKDTETFYSYVSFTEPQTVYRYDLKTGQSNVLFQPKVAFKS